MKKTPSHISIIKGCAKGPNVVIIGSMHGNERLGAMVIAELKKTIKPQNIHGTLTLILGNPPAYEKNTRFIDEDLNRLFGKGTIAELEKKPAKKRNTEEHRACAIAPFLKNTDYLLDIHCTIKKSVPFVYCENTKKHQALAHLFDTHYIVSPDATLKTIDLRQCVDNYVDAHGGIALTYEGGWHKNSITIKEGLQKTLQFLAHIGSIKDSIKKISHRKRIAPRHLKISTEIIPQTPQFTFTKNFHNFDYIAAGEIIATDGTTKIKAKKESFIIFPKLTIISGKPAGYLATPFLPYHDKTMA